MLVFDIALLKLSPTKGSDLNQNWLLNFKNWFETEARGGGVVWSVDREEIQSVSLFGQFPVSKLIPELLLYISLHYTTLHYTTLHYTTLKGG